MGEGYTNIDSKIVFINPMILWGILPLIVFQFPQRSEILLFLIGYVLIR